MAKTDFKSIDEYIRAQPKETQRVLRQVRGIIRRAVPGVTEVISYQMPGFRIAEGGVLALGAWKEHYSLYPTGDAMMAAFKGRLDRYRTSTGTLRFSLSEPVPAKLIERIAQYRVGEAVRRAKAKAARKKAARR